MNSIDRLFARDAEIEAAKKAAHGDCICEQMKKIAEREPLTKEDITHLYGEGMFDENPPEITI